MKIINHEGNAFLLRFDPGEEVLSELSKFCEKEKIMAGTFTAIGATKETILSYFNVEEKIYEDHLLKEEFEMLSVIGNVSIMEGSAIIHAHGTFGNRKLEVKGGHIKAMIVSVTCELTLQVFTNKMERERNEQMKVNLLV